jgi:hypothetical protein
LGFYLVFIPAITFLSGLAGASGWRYCIASGAKPSLTRLFMIRQTGNTVTLFNPSGAIAGELFNARMLIREGVEEQDAYRSVLLMHTLMIVSQLSLFVVVLVQFLFFHSDEWPQDMRLAAGVCFLALMLVVSGLTFLLLGKRKATETLPKAKRWRKIISRIGEMRFLLAMHVRLHPGKTAAAFLLFSTQWILGSMELCFILYFLNNPVDMWDSLFLDTLIILLKSTVAFIPGQLGVEELINKFTLQLLGLSSSGLWLPASILRRARQLFWSGMALCFYVWLKGGRKPGKSHGDIVCES